MKVVYFNNVVEFGLFLVYAVENGYKVDGLKWGIDNGYRIDEENKVIKYAHLSLYQMFHYDLIQPEIGVDNVSIKF